MYYKELKILGFTKNEARVYDVLLRLKSAAAGKIIKETKLHRNLVYENLEKLIEKGLVSYILDGKRKVFQCQPIDLLKNIVEKEKREIQRKQRTIETLQKRLKLDTEESDDFQGAFIFRGIKGVKTIMEITLAQKRDYVVLGAPKQAVEFMPPVFWENFNKRLQEEGIRVKMIFNEALREWSKRIKNEMNEIRFLPERFDSLSETNICADMVYFIIWSHPCIVVLIKDKKLANGYQRYFEEMWKIAKR